MEERKKERPLLPKNIDELIKTGSSKIDGLDVQITKTSYGGSLIKYVRKEKHDVYNTQLD
jgi:hypothetical protein